MTTTLPTLRKTLDTLNTEEQELVTLLNAHADELTAQESVTPRDFARTAELEGQRAAVTSMLTRHRGRITDVQAQIDVQAYEERRAADLQELGQRVTRLGTHRSDTLAKIAELESTVGELLGQITAQRQSWAADRRAALDFAAARFHLSFPTGRTASTSGEWSALRDELTALGFPGEALRHSPHMYPHGDQYPFTEYFPEDMPIHITHYVKAGMGLQLPRPILNALANAISRAETAQPHELKGQL